MESLETACAKCNVNHWGNITESTGNVQGKGLAIGRSSLHRSREYAFESTRIHNHCFLCLYVDAQRIVWLHIPRRGRWQL